MNLKTVVGLILLTLGILGLIYGGFTYTSEEHAIDVGPVELGVEEKENVNIPAWASVIVIVAGTGAIIWGRDGRSITS